MHVTRFELNSEGVRKAKEYQELIRPKSLKDRFASVNRSDWIALGAFLVSLIALFK